MIARMLGVTGTGLFFQGMMIAGIGSAVARLGMDNVITRFISVYFSDNAFDNMVRVVRTGLKAGCAVIFVFFFLYATVSLLIPFSSFQFMVLSIPFLTFSAIYSSALRGVGKAVLFTLIQRGLVPTVFILLLLVHNVLQQEMIPERSFQLYCVASLLVALFSWAVWNFFLSGRNSNSAKHSSPEHFTWTTLWKGGVQHTYVVSLLNLAVFPWAGIFFLGIFSSPEQVGLYGVALRLATQLSFILIASGNVAAPEFAKLHAQGEIRQLEAASQKTSMIVLLVSVISGCIMIGAHREILGVFGKKFIAASGVFFITLTGQMILSFAGNTGMLLMMTGHERELKKTLLISSSVLICCTILLSWIWGAPGAAWAHAIALSVQSSGLIYYCLKHLNINPLPRLKDIYAKQI